MLSGLHVIVPSLGTSSGATTVVAGSSTHLKLFTGSIHSKPAVFNVSTSLPPLPNDVGRNPMKHEHEQDKNESKCKDVGNKYSSVAADPG